MEYRQQSYGKLTAFLVAMIFIGIPLFRPSGLDDVAVPARYFLLALSIAMISGIVFFTLQNSDTVFRSIVNSRWWLCWTIPLIWSGITIFYSSLFSEAVSAWLQLALYWSLLPFLVFLLIKNKDNLFMLPRIAAISGVIHLGFFIYSVLANSKEPSLTAFLKVDYLHGGLAGNKNFLSEILFLNSLFLFSGFRDTNSSWRTIVVFVFIVSAVVLLLLKTFAVGIAIILLLALYLLQSKRTSRAIQLKWLIFSAVITSIFIYYARGYINNRWQQVEQQLWSPIDISVSDTLNSTSAFERKLMWRNSWELIKEQPVFGVGLSDWKMEQMKFGIGGTPFLNSGLVRFEHPHNELLLVFAELGIPGLLLFLLCFGYLLFSLKPSAAEFSSQMTASRFAIIGILVISMFAYPLHSVISMPLLMIHMAIVIAGSSDRQLNFLSISNRKIVVITFMISLCSMLVFAKRWKGEIHRSNAMIAQLRKDHSRSRREAEKSRNYWYKVDQTGTPLNWYIADSYFREGDIQNSLLYFDQALSENPYHLRVLNDYGTACEQSGKTEKAIVLYKTALNYCPAFLEVHFNLAAAYHNTGQSDDAVKVLYRILDKKLIDKKSRGKYLQYTPVILRAYINANKAINSSANDGVELNPQLLTDSMLILKFENSKSPEAFLQDLHR